MSNFKSQLHLALVLFGTFSTFCAFYAPQPLLPLLTEYFSVPATTTALLITVVFVALCLAPLFYGALLQHVSAKLVLLLSMVLLSMTQWWFASAESFSVLMGSRLVQALLFPAIFTSAVTYCSQAGPANKVAQRVSLYVAVTILGGVFGRVASGFVASLYGWQLVFQLSGSLILLSAILLLGIKPDVPTRGKTKSKSIAYEILVTPTFFFGYVLIFTTFFAFSALFNALPFRMVEIDPDISTATISLGYSGYVLGAIIAFNTSRIADWFGGRVVSMTVALCIFIVGLLLLLGSNVWWVIGNCFLTAAGMFLIHSTLSGFLTSLRPQHASVINGLYIGIYYGAGALGSVLPLWLYKQQGWLAFLFLITFVACFGFLSLKRLSLESKRHRINNDG